MSTKLAITYGADVEFFVATRSDASSAVNLFTPAVTSLVPMGGIWKGTKAEPEVVQSAAGLTIQEDNISLEVGCNPDRSLLEVQGRINDARLIAESTMGPDGGVLCVAAASIRSDPATFDSPHAKAFGCDPDRDAYAKGAMRTMPDGMREGFGDVRFGGGHIHIGYDVEQIPRDAFVRLLDLTKPWWTNALPCPVRGLWYGQPGVYRDKPYGIEYRSLSTYEFMYVMPRPFDAVVRGMLADPGAAFDLHESTDWETVRKTRQAMQTYAPGNRLDTARGQNIYLDGAKGFMATLLKSSPLLADFLLQAFTKAGVSRYYNVNGGLVLLRSDWARRMVVPYLPFAGKDKVEAIRTRVAKARQYHNEKKVAV